MSGSERSPEQWAEILHEMDDERAAKFILGDLTHYRHGGGYERNDERQLANVIRALRGDRT